VILWPAIGERLVVEGLDLLPSGGLVERENFGELAVGLDMSGGCAWPAGHGAEERITPTRQLMTVDPSRHE
jgi:hypothetical protein